jgi:pyruvate dehydrogenase E1 component beta subunit
MPQKSTRQALNGALRQEMRRDPRIIVIGEDVAGGAVSESAALTDVFVSY